MIFSGSKSALIGMTGDKSLGMTGIMTALLQQHGYRNHMWTCAKLLEGAEVILGLPTLISDLYLGSARVWIFLDSVSDLCRCGIWDSAAWITLFIGADIYSF